MIVNAANIPKNSVSISSRNVPTIFGGGFEGLRIWDCSRINLMTCLNSALPYFILTIPI